MSLKSVLNAQRSGDLDLDPGSVFNQRSPLTIVDNFAYVMMGGEEWYYAEINNDLILEAVELIGVNKSDVRISNAEILDNNTGRALFSGEDTSDLFAELASKAGIYTERH